MRSYLTLGPMAVLGLFLALSTVPCRSQEPEKVLTLRQINLQVEESMKQFRNASIAGNVTTGEREGVETAYKEFQTTYNTALEQAGGKKQAKKSPASEEVKAAAETLTGLISELPGI